jgi:hypothetical protein
MIFSENFSSVEIFLEWKWALITSPTLLYINFMFIFFRIWSTNWSRNWAETWKIVYWRWWNRKFCMMLNAYVVECGYVPPPELLIARFLVLWHWTPENSLELIELVGFV